jgi:aryl-alcohol dehydrogenase-like predicted oxidoreductase
MGVIPWSPLHGGLLGGILAATTQGRRRLEGRAKEGLQAHREQVERYEALCARLGEQPADVALAWLLSRPAVTAPIIGPRTLAQLDSAVHAVDVHLSAPTLTELDEIFPGYRTAPEDYAW